MEKDQPENERLNGSKDLKKNEDITIQFQIGKNPTRSLQFSPQKLFLILFASMTITFMGIAGLAFLAKDFNYKKLSGLLSMRSEIKKDDANKPKDITATLNEAPTKYKPIKYNNETLRKNKRELPLQKEDLSPQVVDPMSAANAGASQLSSASKSILDKVFKSRVDPDFSGSPYFKARIKNLRIHDNRELWLKVNLSNSKKFPHLRGKIGALIQASHTEYSYDVFWIENRFENFSSIDHAMKIALVKDYSFRSEVEKEFSFPIQRLNLNQYKNFTAILFLNDRNFNHIQSINISSWLEKLKTTKSKNMNFAH